MEPDKLLNRAKELYAKNQKKDFDPKTVQDEVYQKIVEKGYFVNEEGVVFCLKCNANLRTNETQLAKWKICPNCKTKI